MNVLTQQTAVANHDKRLPLLPLPMVLLPGGIQRITIYDAMQLESIKQATGEGSFVVSLHKAGLPYNSATWGVRVRIIDFSYDDHFLEVGIQADTMVQLTNIARKAEAVLYADIEPQIHWSARQFNARGRTLGDQLRNIFHSNPALSHLYRETFFNDPYWVCARFIEVLPLSLIEKEKFILEYRFEHIEAFLNTLILGSVKKN